MQKKKIQIKISTDHKISQDRFFSQRHSRGASRFFFLKGDAAGSNSRSLQLFFFYFDYVCSAEKAYGLQIFI